MLKYFVSLVLILLALGNENDETEQATLLQTFESKNGVEAVLQKMQQQIQNLEQELTYLKKEKIQNLLPGGFFTSPYYIKMDGCDEGDWIDDVEDCKKAAAAQGYPTDKFEEANDSFSTKKCSGSIPGPYSTHSSYFNSNFDSEAKTFWSLCRRNDMPDFAAMKADLHMMIFHCLDAASKAGDVDNFENFRECLHQIDASE